MSNERNRLTTPRERFFRRLWLRRWEYAGVGVVIAALAVAVVVDVCIPNRIGAWVSGFITASTGIGVWLLAIALRWFLDTGRRL